MLILRRLSRQPASRLARLARLARGAGGAVQRRHREAPSPPLRREGRRDGRHPGRGRAASPSFVSPPPLTPASPASPRRSHARRAGPLPSHRRCVAGQAHSLRQFPGAAPPAHPPASRPPRLLPSETPSAHTPPQVGCPMRCTFCATGKGGFARNLKPHEIVDQARSNAPSNTPSNALANTFERPLLIDTI